MTAAKAKKASRQHDWGIDQVSRSSAVASRSDGGRAKAAAEQRVPPADVADAPPVVKAADVPDALRARIKAMLAKSSL
jgi:hypothetical protein